PRNHALALPMENPFRTTRFGSMRKRFEAAARDSKTSASPAQLKALFIRPKGSNPNWPSLGDQPGVLPAFEGQLAVAYVPSIFTSFSLPKRPCSVMSTRKGLEPS